MVPSGTTLMLPHSARTGSHGRTFEQEAIMVKPRIIVTGATGKTGSVVVSELLKAGYPVRAMVHREDRRSAFLKTQGAEVVVVEMSDVERVADALEDVQRAYYCPPLDPYMIQGAARPPPSSDEHTSDLHPPHHLLSPLLLEKTTSH